MLAFIDCYLESPANHCVNRFIEQTKIPATYHIPSKFGQTSLENLNEATAYIILGSATHVTDRPDWQSPLADFIDQKLQEGFPVLGICYGHQLMAHYYGCELDFIFEDKKVLKEARKINIKTPFWNYSTGTIELPYAHGQIISKLSDQFEELAYSQYPNEIIRHRTLPFYGIQAHPEASLNFLKTQTHIEEQNINTVLTYGLEFLKSFYKYSQTILELKQS